MQIVKKNRDPRWDEEFSYTLEEPPTNDRMHFEVVSTSSRLGLLHPKVQRIIRYLTRLTRIYTHDGKMCGSIFTTGVKFLMSSIMRLTLFLA